MRLFPVGSALPSYRIKNAALRFAGAVSGLLLAGHPINFALADEIGKLYSSEGVVQVRSAAESFWKAAPLGYAFEAGDTVRVTDPGRAGVMLKNGILIRLRSGSTLTLGKDALDAGEGEFHFLSRRPREYPRIETRTVSAAIRGTEFVLVSASTRTELSMLSGAVELSNAQGSLLLASGEKGVARLNSAPVKELVVDTKQAVQWAVRFPNLLAYLDPKDLDPVLGRAGITRADNPAAAIGKLRALKSEPGPVGRLYEGSLYLSLGQLDRARELLSAARRSGGALAAEQRDFIERTARAEEALALLALGRKEEAASLLEGEPRASVPTLVASSYLAQAEGELESALDLAKKAVAAAPESELARLRLAELLLSTGNIKDANGALKDLPVSAEALTLQGYLSLFEEKPEEARAAFEQALTIDPACANAHLGLALSIVRSGDVEAAKPEFEMAVQLEPARSEYRSYLGKALYELEVEELALGEYKTAMELDPEDPTPHLYRAFAQISRNRVAEALSDVERSIQLNNNRAVYRSSFLLDQDLGVRSAALSRVFNELGFSEAAKLEAIKSSNRDYTNFSAHRLLSESQRFADVDASLSERRIADILSPLTFNMLETIGGTAGLDEYTALFDMEESRTYLDAFFDSRRDTYFLEASRSSRQRSIGHFARVQTALSGGTKNNSFERHYRLDLASRFQPTFQDKFLFDVRGDFLEARELNGDATEQEIPFSISLAYSRLISPGENFIIESAVDRRTSSTSLLSERDGSLTFMQDGMSESLDDVFRVQEGARDEATLWRNSVQYIKQSSAITSILGAEASLATFSGREDSLVEGDTETGLFDTDNPGRLETRDFVRSTSGRAYTYHTLHVSPMADFTAGADYSSVEMARTEFPPYVDGSERKERFNPKLGLTLYPTAELTLRAAWFETLRRATVAEEVSIEPVYVAGISQRNLVSGGLMGEQSRNLGLGADYKIPSLTYLGAEWLKRDVVLPMPIIEEDYIIDADLREERNQADFLGVRDSHARQDVVRSYIYQMLPANLSATADYLYAVEHATDPEIASRVETNKMALGIRHFDPGGWFSFGRATYRDQNLRQSLITDSNGDSFWLFDIGTGYRFPNRHGVVTLTVQNLTDETFVYDNLGGFEEDFPSGLTLRLEGRVNF